MLNKAEIARSNGAKSNGPIAEAGKAISSQNARTHGLTSARVVLPHESQEEFDHLEAGIAKHFNPVSEFERELVHEMAAARWRLRRIEEMEAALFQKFFVSKRKPSEPKPIPSPSARPPTSSSPIQAPSACSRAHRSQLRRAYGEGLAGAQSLERAAP